MHAEGRPRDIPPLWLLVAILIMLTLHFWLPVGRWLWPPWVHVGWLVLAAALWFMVRSVLGFCRAGTGVRPFSPVTALVENGPFRLSRNPMYVGIVGVAVGVAICLGTVTPLAVPPLLFVVLDRRFVRREEVFLRQHLGAAYDDYCARVRRWL